MKDKDDGGAACAIQIVMEEYVSTCLNLFLSLFPFVFLFPTN